MRTACFLLLFASSLVNLHASQHHYCWSEGTRRFDVTGRGSIEFSDDDRDVKSISPGGYFRVEEDYFLLFAGRWYEVSADSQGRLSRTYYDHGHERPLDSQGLAWLMRAMPEAIRHTGIGAGPRLQRILKQGGTAAALTEISRIDSDEAKRIYIQELVTKNALGREPLEGAMLQARKIGSDDEKADLVKSVASYYLKDGLREPIFQVAGTIGSDEDRANVLCDLIVQDGASRESLKLAAKTASHIGSDEEKAKVLSGLRSDTRVIVRSAGRCWPARAPSAPMKSATGCSRRCWQEAARIHPCCRKRSAPGRALGQTKKKLPCSPKPLLITWRTTSPVAPSLRPPARSVPTKNGGKSCRPCCAGPA